MAPAARRGSPTIDPHGVRPRAWARLISLDGVLIAVVMALSLGAAASLAVPGLPTRIVNPSFDLVIDTLATFVTLAVAVLGWARFREGGDPAAAFQAAAFLVLAIVNGLAVALVATGLDLTAGLVLSAPTEAPAWVLSLARMLAAGLLVIGGIASLRARRMGHGVAIVIGSAVATLVLMALAWWWAGSLPPLWTMEATLRGAGPVVGYPALPVATPLGAVLQVVIAGLFLWGAAVFRRMHHRGGAIGHGYLAVGLVFAAFAQVQTAVSPGAFTGIVSSGDGLRLAFYVILLLGIQAQAGALIARLRLANEALARSKEIDAEHAALEERARLARELHDGLAQDLWLAKLKMGRLAAQPDLADEVRLLAGELNAALDAGLADAQHAMAAMRAPGEAIGTFAELMSRSVDEFADRFGLRIEFECEGTLPQLSARAQAEALRIAREALTNVRRHADATVVRVRAGVEDGRFVVVVGDNGCGFDPEAVGRGAFGLAGMRERAALIGGELRIDSRPQGGTRVSLLVPVPLAVEPVLAGVR